MRGSMFRHRQRLNCRHGPTQARRGSSGTRPHRIPGARVSPALAIARALPRVAWNRSGHSQSADATKVLRDPTDDGRLGESPRFSTRAAQHWKGGREADRRSGGRTAGRNRCRDLRQEGQGDLARRRLHSFRLAQARVSQRPAAGRAALAGRLLGLARRRAGGARVLRASRQPQALQGVESEDPPQQFRPGVLTARSGDASRRAVGPANRHRGTGRGHRHLVRALHRPRLRPGGAGRGPAPWAAPAVSQRRARTGWSATHRAAAMAVRLSSSDFRSAAVSGAGFRLMVAFLSSPVNLNGTR